MSSYATVGDDTSPQGRSLRKVEKQLLSVREFAASIGIGETLAKKLIREQRVISVLVGDRRLVPTSAVKSYVDSLVAEAAGERELATA